MIIDSQVVACKREQWQGRASAARFAEETEVGHGPQHLKNTIETEIVRRYRWGSDLLDVGIGTGRVSLPLVDGALRLTGVDASAAMIERCAADPRAADVRLVHADLAALPFARETFDTVISVDTFAHFPDWTDNLDELLRVTRIGGRTIVDVGSREHIEAVAAQRDWPADRVRAAELEGPDAFTLRLSAAELHAYAVERGSALIALVPYGIALGSLVPNHWLSASFVARSGALDRLVSWLGTDPQLFAFAEFIERRIAQAAPLALCGRMFAVLEKLPRPTAYRVPVAAQIAAADERGAAAWQAEFAAHVEHEPSLTFAVALLLAARPVRLPSDLRSLLPRGLADELARAERALDIDAAATAAAAAWRAAGPQLTFHGVDLAPVFESPLRDEMRARLEPSA